MTFEVHCTQYNLFYEIKVCMNIEAQNRCNLRIILRSKSKTLRILSRPVPRGSGSKSPEVPKFSFVPPEKISYSVLFASFSVSLFL